MSDAKIPFVLNHWQEKFEIQHYKITCEKIFPLQVCDDYFRRGHEFVGICTNHSKNKACLYHTRKLQTADIIHELLHVKHPHWPEKQINDETGRLLIQKYTERR